MVTFIHLRSIITDKLIDYTPYYVAIYALDKGYIVFFLSDNRLPEAKLAVPPLYDSRGKPVHLIGFQGDKSLLNPLYIPELIQYDYFVRQQQIKSTVPPEYEERFHQQNRDFLTGASTPHVIDTSNFLTNGNIMGNLSDGTVAFVILLIMMLLVIFLTSKSKSWVTT